MGPAPTGAAMPEPFPPTGNAGTFASSPPDYQPLWVYGIQPNGELLWYRKDTQAAAWEGPRTVGVGWNGLKDVIAAGGNRFYGLTQDGKLMWYQHDGFNTGEFKWKGGTEVGNGWNFKRLFAGGDGVIYTIRQDGKLFWYRHLGFHDGTFNWSEPKKFARAGVASRMCFRWARVRSCRSARRRLAALSAKRFRDRDQGLVSHAHHRLCLAAIPANRPGGQRCDSHDSA